MNKCEICPRKCTVDRRKSIGFCGSNDRIKIGKIMLHEWEEPILAEKKSGAIFFSNCPLKCIFCQNYEISQLGRGKEVSVEELVEIFRLLENKGAENIDLVSPTQYTNQIVEALKIYKPKVPVIWNSNAYETVESLEKLRGLVDIFLPDLKYASEKLAIEYSGSPNYFSIATKAIQKMKELCPENIFNGEKLVRGMIVRHLVLPNHYLNTKLVLSWIRQTLGNDTIISIMSQYTPYYKAINHKILSNKISEKEYNKIINLVGDLGFNNGFFQELNSADECYIPDFEESF